MTRVFGSSSPLLTPSYNVTNCFYKSNAAVQVVNTAAATPIAALTLPAGIMQYVDDISMLTRADRVLRGYLLGKLINNSGVAANLRVQILLGASTVLDTGNISIAAAATGRSLELAFRIAARNSQAAQFAYSSLIIGGIGSSDVAPIAPLSSVSYTVDSLTQDLTVDTALQVIVTLGAAATTLEVDCYSFLLELI